MRLLTTGSYLMVQFRAIQVQFVAFGIVPEADGDDLGDRCFEVVA